MTWLVGIDEAGYGPNLGPFVMTAVACRLPEQAPSADLWTLLQTCVRRQGDPDDGRLLIDDSKVVYATGLARLETGVLGMFGKLFRASCLNDLIHLLSPVSRAELAREAWYTGTTALPIEADPLYCGSWTDRLAAHEHIHWPMPCAAVVCPERFNGVLDRAGSKGAVLSQCLGELLQPHLERADDEPLAVHVDKHGGRNTYRAMLQDLLEDGMVLVVEEGRERSVYRLVGLQRPITVTFQPRADAEHFCVALASMVSKYLREVLMLEFNRFWQQHVPNLKPTAGYPGDALRFFKAIDTAAAQLGIVERCLWRKK